MSCKLWISKLQCSLLGHLPAPETGRVMEAVIAPNGVTAGRTIEWEKSPPSLWFIHPSLLCPPFISRSLSKWSWRTVFERGGQTFVDNLNALYNICSCIKTVACRPAGHAQCPISRPLPLPSPPTSPPARCSPRRLSNGRLSASTDAFMPRSRQRRTRAYRTNGGNASSWSENYFVARTFFSSWSRFFSPCVSRLSLFHSSQTRRESFSPHSRRENTREMVEITGIVGTKSCNVHCKLYYQECSMVHEEPVGIRLLSTSAWGMNNWIYSP